MSQGQRRRLWRATTQTAPTTHRNTPRRTTLHPASVGSTSHKRPLRTRVTRPSIRYERPLRPSWRTLLSWPHTLHALSTVQGRRQRRARVPWWRQHRSAGRRLRALLYTTRAGASANPSRLVHTPIWMVRVRETAGECCPDGARASICDRVSGGIHCSRELGLKLIIRWRWRRCQECRLNAIQPVTICIVIL